MKFIQRNANEYLEYKSQATNITETNSYPAQMATPDLFHKVQIPVSEDEQFKEGQKLEAVDPLEMSRICPATVCKVERVMFCFLSIFYSTRF